MIRLKSTLHFLPPDGGEFSPEALAAAAGYRLRENRVYGPLKPSASPGSYYDTFDWRLFKKGLALVREAEEYHLYSFSDGRELATHPAVGRVKAKFSRDFSPGPLRGRLEKIVEMRALLPLLTVRSTTRRFEMLNGDQKIVLRCALREFKGRRWLKMVSPPAPAESAAEPSAPPESAVDPEPLRLFSLEPVTGYHQPLRRLSALLTDRGLLPQAGIIERLYRQAGYQPGSYSQKLNVHLEPDWPAAQAALAILQHQSRVLRQNEAGIIADLDSEFLHDFRVALRRSRAALARLKGVLPPAVAGRFRDKLGALAKASNRLRDLDVYLLKKEEYRQLLPPCLQLGLEPLFTALEVERRREWRRLVRKLKSSTSQRALAQWEEFLAGHDFRAAGAGKQALEPVAPLASRAIAKACARVLAQGRAIAPDSPDQQLHALRLECKKLRYLFEFFATLFPPATIGPLIAQSKKLQENLGAFNDLFVQQERLRQFLADLERGGGSRQTTATAAALGGLITRLHRQQQRVRREFAKTFQAFAACQYRKQLCPEA